MFTVKVRESRNETEVVFEASQVRKTLFPENQRNDQSIGEIRIDPLDGSGQITYGIRASAPADNSEDITMYIMNRFGATVATFHL